jgi:hypothetical protein
MHVNKDLSFTNMRKRLSQTFCGLPYDRGQEKTRHEIHDVIVSAFGMLCFREPCPRLEHGMGR